MQYLQFIFSSFWIWLGTLLLISSVAGLVKAFWNGMIGSAGYGLVADKLEASIEKAVRKAIKN